MYIDKKPTINDFPPCLCHVVFKIKKTAPNLVYNRKDNFYYMYCPTCGFKTFSDSNKQAVISSWYSSNRSNDVHIKNIWIANYNKQHYSV